MLPSGNVCISNFANVRSKIEAPFRGTFKGTVVELQDADYSSQGNQKRHFKLVDPSGLYFECCALGKNAGSVALAESMEVVLYFVTSRSNRWFVGYVVFDERCCHCTTSDEAFAAASTDAASHFKEGSLDGA